jgi:alpha/beta superfamily hydrolase
MEPKLCFTIPSVHDDTTIACRIYYSIDPSKSPPKSCVARGAIVAHPYAPLGGCYDDPVVGLVVSEMLERKFGFVCTFNFRYVNLWMPNEVGNY